MSFTNLIIEGDSSLPPDWKLCRGRGRKLQKSNMTKEQLEEENKLILEKNRLAAISSRRKKKNKMNTMEKKIQELEEIISSFNDKTLYAKMKSKIDTLQEVVSYQGETIKRLWEEKNTE